MTKKRWQDIIAIIFICCVVAFMFRHELTSIVGNIIYSDYTLEELTEEEKIADFEYFYSNMLESVPYLDEIKEVYGIDFQDRKDYYLSEILATDDNVEFYGVMAAISMDLASFHTDVCFPMYSNLQTLNCYASEDVLSQWGMEARLSAWYEEIGKEAERYKDIGLFCIRYVDGKYILKEGWLSDEYKNMANYELLSVDGQSADEYVMNHISIYSVAYDSLWNKPYRTNYTFNDSIGEEVKVIWKDLEGNQIEQILYTDKGIEVVASYGYLYSDRYDYYAGVSTESFVVERDDINQLEYIQVNSFDNKDGRELQRYLANTTYDKIVIDLRYNYGGVVSYAQDYIFPELYSEDARIRFEWKVPNTDLNKKMTDRLGVNLLYFEDKDQEYYYYAESLNFDGRATERKEIYYLVGPDTGSAADKYIAVIKENGLGTIVGTNTGGEGRGASYICDSLKESSLVYVYYPSESISEDNNLICGAAPDIYINQSVGDYALYEKMRVEGIASLYESRLQYDTVLKWVIEQ